MGKGVGIIQLIVACICIASCFLIVEILRRVEPTRGRVWRNHAYFAGVACFLIFLTPLKAQQLMYNPLTIIIIGSALPIYESCKAVATLDEKDDKKWLTYWCALGAIQYTTYWMDDVATKSPDHLEWWFVTEFYILLWLLLPYTDGSALLFDYITEPFLAPLVTPLTSKFEGLISKIVTLTVSAAHMWILWAAFAVFPATFKRFIALSFGHIYPVMASIVAVITPLSDDDTYWLTYWCCFMPLLIIMEFFDRWLGKVPGYYVLMIFGTAYLMVPLFAGAENIYRSIIVPLAGLEKELMIRDAKVMKRSLEMKIPKERSSSVRKEIAEIFLEEDNDNYGSRTPLL